MREVLQHRDYRKAIWTEHEQILRAIAAHDADGAAALVRAHLYERRASTCSSRCPTPRRIAADSERLTPPVTPR